MWRYDKASVNYVVSAHSGANYMLNTFFKGLCFWWGNLQKRSWSSAQTLKQIFIIEICLTGACSSPTPASHLSWVAIKESEDRDWRKVWETTESTDLNFFPSFYFTVLIIWLCEMQHTTSDVLDRFLFLFETRKV